MLRYLAALPIVHLIACYLYLYVLYAGFGSNVVQFSSLDNVFSVSISKIIPLYISVILYFIVAHLYLIDKPLAVVNRDSFPLHASVRSKGMKVVFLAILVLTVLQLLIIYWRFNEIWLAGLMLVLSFPAGWLSGKVLAENQVDERWWPLVWLAIYSFALLIAWAYRDGFEYRHSDASEFISEYPTCDDYVVLFPIGEKYIAVDQQERRGIISDECDLIMAIPPAKVTLGLR